jgi:hypothetical protein
MIFTPVLMITGYAEAVPNYYYGNYGLTGNYRTQYSDETYSFNNGVTPHTTEIYDNSTMTVINGYDFCTVPVEAQRSGTYSAIVSVYLYFNGTQIASYSVPLAQTVHVSQNGYNLYVGWTFNPTNFNFWYGAGQYLLKSEDFIYSDNDITKNFVQVGYLYFNSTYSGFLPKPINYGLTGEIEVLYGNNPYTFNNGLSGAMHSLNIYNDSGITIIRGFDFFDVPYQYIGTEEWDAIVSVYLYRNNTQIAMYAVPIGTTQSLGVNGALTGGYSNWTIYPTNFNFTTPGQYKLVAMDYIYEHNNIEGKHFLISGYMFFNVTASPFHYIPPVTPVQIAPVITQIIGVMGVLMLILGPIGGLFYMRKYDTFIGISIMVLMPIIGFLLVMGFIIGS